MPCVLIFDGKYVTGIVDGSTGKSFEGTAYGLYMTGVVSCLDGSAMNGHRRGDIPDVCGNATPPPPPAPAAARADAAPDDPCNGWFDGANAVPGNG